ncbi:ubiquitin-conjugating enzyme/RWD-like protein [Bombardia bombarda]|uniref:Ubiquitin-conjugating enzyme/RWD-like protein n=1 Tax=Bombardia bombarda TaxID=252184 RepID=A0AA39X0L7_9PEZI|nr:ubiquitin-conjugating enzyme/RWD-like protein [Bombardia bombarda]
MPSTTTSTTTTSSSSSSSSSNRTAARRLIKELTTWTKHESRDERGIERLGPVRDDELLRWEAVINGRGLGGGYEHGRWLLRITIPAAYPLQPPQIVFVTPIVHANVALKDGEICLDLLKDAWTPAYSILECVRAVRMLLSCPEVDSPLNVDVASLIRDGDFVGARGLVELWVGEKRFGGSS